MSTFSNRGPRSIREHLDGRSGEFSRLLEHAAGLARLQRQLRAALPPPLDSHLSVEAFDNNILHLQADSPAWAARLRMRIPQLLALARKSCGLPSLQTIRVRVSVAPPLPARKRPPRLSRRAAETLRRTAESETDPELRDCLLRLSENSSPSDP